MTGPRQSDMALPHIDVMIVGGEVVDGSGAAGRPADVAVSNGMIVAVDDGLADRMTATTVIDASGLTVAPGFVDIHGHSDLTLLSAPDAPSKIRQGVTTEVVGNCGLAVAPLADHVEIDAYRTAMASGDLDTSVAWDWRTVAGYRDRLAKAPTAINVAVLTGHLPVRVSALGYADRAPTAAELATMCDLVDTALEEGACGLSTGLSLPPMSFAALDELVALGEVVARHDALFTFHMRDYTNGLLAAVDEALTVARRTGCRVQLSHLAVIGRSNWGTVARALDMIDEARNEGIDVAADIYPYIAGSGNLTQMFPDWALEGGTEAQLARLHDPQQRAQVVEGIRDKRLLGSWDDVLVAGGRFAHGTGEVVGLRVSEIAKAWETTPWDATATLVERSEVTAVMVAFGRSEDDVADALRHPAVMIGSDGRALDPDGPTGEGKPHPRAYGCYPRLLGRYARDNATLSFEAAIHKSTAQPAQRFGFTDRGVVAPSYAADLVVLDRHSVIDHATFEDPHQFPGGVRDVIVNGEPVILSERPTGARPGMVLG